MKLHHKLFLLLLFLLPTQLGYHFWPEWASVFGIRVDYLSPTIYLTDLLLVLVITIWLFDKKHKIPNLGWVLAICLFAVVNIVLANSWQVSIYKWLKAGEMVLLVFYVRQNWKYLRDKIYLPLALSMLSILLISIGQLFFQKTLGLWILGERNFTANNPGIALADFFGRSFMRPYATFPHPNSMAGYSLVSGAILFILNKYLKGKAKLLSFVGIGISIILVFLSFSQLAWISFVFTILAILFKKTFILKFKLITVIFLIFSLILPFVSLGLLKKYSFSESIKKRLELSIVSGSIISKKPLFGVGLGNFVAVKNDYQKLLKLGSDTIWSFQPVHNIFLLVFPETGILGLSLFLYLFLKSASHSDRKYLILLLPILLTGLGDHYWLTLQQNILLLAIAFGIIFSAKISKNA